MTPAALSRYRRCEKLLPSAVIYGANASGKSNLLKALGLMKSMIEDSHKRGGPNSRIERAPFVLEPAAANEPTRLCVEFVEEGIRYEYGFEAFSERFKTEWLNWWPHGVRSLLFSRDGQTFAFGRGLKGPNRGASCKII
jgi:predicted ATPase